MLAIHDILVPTDFSEAADAALIYGRELASRFGATLHLVHVVGNLHLTPFADVYGDTVARLQADIEEGAAKQLHERLLDSDGSGPPTRRAVLPSTSPVAAIVDYAKERGIELIVMGTHGRGAMTQLLMGSVAERVVRSAPCPVLTVRKPEREFVRPDTLAVAAKTS
jgi:nucleotide-binding universal stress UspA family protein